MKKIKKYVQIGLLMLMLAVLISGTPTHFVEASFGNQFIVQNQFQYMSQENRQQMFRLLTQLHERLQRLLWLYNFRSLDSEVQIATRSATDIDTDDALLRGEVLDFNNSDYADVWFEYDTDRSDLDRKTSTQRIDDNDDEDFQRRVTGLKKDTSYYFRAVGEDDEGERDYGAILRFYTDDSTADEDPDIVTRSAVNITDDSADLRGTVDMNDFRNGEVFFVYGEDKSQVEDVEDDFDTYRAVDEDGEDLQKVQVDRDLDSSDSYQEDVISLDDNTKHYFSICVGYEDEDSDDVIECGSVRSFVTD